jgi:hypothetical protein
VLDSLPLHARFAEATYVDEEDMNHLRMILVAVLAFGEAGAIWAQSPPPPGAFPSANALLQSSPEPTIIIGDNASPNVPRMWFHWGVGMQWVNPSPYPAPLVTTSVPADAGIIGNPTTTVLLGQTTVDYGRLGFFYFGSGAWFNPERTVGTEGSSTWSEQRSRHAIFESDAFGNPGLYRPVIDPVTQTETSMVIADPLNVAGTFIFESRIRVNNSDANLLFNIARDEARAVTAMVGYRIAYMREEMRLIQSSTALFDGALQFLGNPLLAGDTLTIRDRIETVNRIYAGQVGLRLERYMGRLYLAGTGKLGIGWSNQRIFGDGRTTLEPDVQTVPGGGVVQPSFPYRNQVEDFIFIPEVGATVRFRMLRRLHLSASYNFTWFSSVSRPGSYVDRVVQFSQVPHSTGYTGVVGTRPQFVESDHDMYLHGFQAGLTWIY